MNNITWSLSNTKQPHIVLLFVSFFFCFPRSISIESMYKKITTSYDFINRDYFFSFFIPYHGDRNEMFVLEFPHWLRASCHALHFVFCRWYLLFDVHEYEFNIDSNLWITRKAHQFYLLKWKNLIHQWRLNSNQ
jgi:hypothetical protein